MRVRLFAVLVGLPLLAACVGNARQGEVAHYDLGNAALAWRPAQVPLAGVDTAAPSWLAGTAMHYRLLYADAQRRSAYAESRWAAPPAELVGRALNRQTTTASGCRLKLDIDDLAQVFGSPQDSRVALDVRATLQTPRGEPLVRKAFAAAAAAPTANAAGSAAGTAAAVQVLAGDLGKWLTELARDMPAVVERCKG